VGSGRAWRGGGGVSSAQGGPKCGGCWQGAREKCTANMYSMVVTLEVSRLSGWLNADAPCRVERKA
jgi:hypothetical protein